MDYERLAKELVQKMQLSQKAGHQRFMQEGVHGEAFVLRCIKEKPGEIVPSEIGNRMGISGPRVAKILSSLESKGFITREIDINDRRRIIVKFTEKGIAYEGEQWREFMGKITKMLTMLGEKDAEDYVRITGKLAEMMPKIK